MTGHTSVIIPCYNRDAYLEETLESVCSQTRPVREIIVVDDGSSTPVQMPSAWKGPSLRIVRTENRGVAAARNSGIALATGRFVAFLDSDDAWAPTKIEMQEESLLSSSDAVAVFTHRIEKPGWPPCPSITYPPPNLSNAQFWQALWREDSFVTTSSVMVRRDVLLRVGAFDERLRYCEDWELFFRLLAHGAFLHLPLPLCYRRIHPGQMIKNFDALAVYRRRARLLVMSDHQSRLEDAGVSRQQQRRDAQEEYRGDILILYFRRQFSVARRLLWNYLLHYPGDSAILKYALLALLPPRLLEAVRAKLAFLQES